jgi:hypothetical protein
VHAPIDIDLGEQVRHFVRTGRRLQRTGALAANRVRASPSRAAPPVDRGPYFRRADADRIVTRTRRVGCDNEPCEQSKSMHARGVAAAV